MTAILIRVSMEVSALMKPMLSDVNALLDSVASAAITKVPSPLIMNKDRSLYTKKTFCLWNAELCPAEEEVTANRGTFNWPQTEFGQTVALDCISGAVIFQTNRHQLGQNNDNKTYAFRSCNIESNGRVHWMESDASNCKLQVSFSFY